MKRTKNSFAKYLLLNQNEVLARGKRTFSASLRFVKILGAFLVLLYLGLVTSCSSSDRPEGVLSKSEMANALTQFYLKDAKLNTLHLGQDSTRALFRYYRQQFAEQNGFADSVVDQSYQYYAGRPGDLSEIYDQIIDSLVLMEQRVNFRER